jgi:hypothetical protein
MNTLDDRAASILKRVDKAMGDRVTWESHWTEIAEYVVPAYSDMFLSRGVITPGQKKTEKVFDSTAQSALTRFRSVMESILTPRNQTWHRIKPTNPYLMKDRETQLWFEQANDLLFRYRYSPTANYASQQSEIYSSLGAFGTGCLFVDKLDKGKGFRYRAVFLGEVYFVENHQGIIDTVYRCFSMTARQIMQKWGDKSPQKVKETVEKKPDDNYEIVHCVYPNEERAHGRIDYKGMEYASVYLCRSTKEIISEGGYDTMPYIVSRYTTLPGENYGRSPAMDVLPAIKTLNEQEKTLLKQGHRTVDPVLLAYDDGVLDSFSMKPGAVNYGGVSADGRQLVHSLPTGNLAVGRDMMEDKRAVINDAFLITLFQILVETPQMTATEVLERAREKSALLAPIMGRQQSEALGPMIEREIDIAMEQRLLPEITDTMREAGADYKVEYESPLSRMQKAEASAGGLRMFQYAGEIAANTQDPSALDWFNVDEMIPALADAQAMPASWMRSKKDVDAIREGRQQQAATQQLIDAAPAMASMMKQGVGAPT